MDLILALIFSFTLLIFTVLNGYFIAYPLLISMGVFIAILLRRGFRLENLLEMAFLGSQKSFPVLIILLLIGAVTAVWMAAGTVPAIVYYGIQFIRPQYFIFAAFVLTSLVSLLIGTSFGTVSTIGIALMIMAKGSDIDPHIVAGAIISGAYLGDRCSPMSSSANLVATVTKTNLYTNIQNMWMTALSPLAISAFIYCILSLLNPVQIANQTFLIELSSVFRIDLIDLLPAMTILVLSVLQVEVKLSMLTSLGVAIAIALFYQHYALLELLKFILLGFSLEAQTPLKVILLGGGILSMVKVCGVVILSTAFVGIFAGTHILQTLEERLQRSKTRSDCFLSTCFVGTGSAAFGCTQAIAILLTQQLVEKQYTELARLDHFVGAERPQNDPTSLFFDPKCMSREYKETEKGNYKLALDLENTVVVISPLIPWNIAGLVPATILMTDSGFIPYAFYLYLIPLLNLIQIRLSQPPKLKRCN